MLVLVLVLVAAVVVPVGIAVAVLVTLLVRKHRALHRDLDAALAGATVLIGPESAIYRGTTGSYPRASGNGLIALTSERLLFRKLVGAGLDVERSHITGVRTAKSFNRSVVGGRVHLVVATPNGEIGFFVDDLDEWVHELS